MVLIFSVFLFYMFYITFLPQYFVISFPIFTQNCFLTLRSFVFLSIILYFCCPFFFHSRLYNILIISYSLSQRLLTTENCSEKVSSSCFKKCSRRLCFSFFFFFFFLTKYFFSFTFTCKIFSKEMQCQLSQYCNAGFQVWFLEQFKKFKKSFLCAYIKFCLKN